MNNDEINKYIHTQIMGKCWHDFGKDGLEFAYCQNQNCRGLVLVVEPNPDYCSNKSSRELLNEPFTRLMQEIDEVAFGRLLVQSDAFNPFTANGVGLGIWMTADAETLSRFCVEVHKALQQDRTSR